MYNKVSYTQKIWGLKMISHYTPCDPKVAKSQKRLGPRSFCKLWQPSLITPSITLALCKANVFPIYANQYPTSSHPKIISLKTPHFNPVFFWGRHYAIGFAIDKLARPEELNLVEAIWNPFWPSRDLGGFKIRGILGNHV